MNDWSLIQAHVNGESEGAFAELVRRHGAMVYATALRLVHDSHLAQDITQAVFLVLARKANRLSSGVVLGGWLYRTTCLLSKRALRDQTRRMQRERSTLEMWDDKHSDVTAWAQIEPHLDPALESLSQIDRDAVVLRFLEQRSFREVGEALSLSEEAAKKRVQRALEKLREFIVSRGAAITTASLAALLASHANAAIPEQLLTNCTALNGREQVRHLAQSVLRESWVAPMKWAVAAASVALVLYVYTYRPERTSPSTDRKSAAAEVSTETVTNAASAPSANTPENPGFLVKVLAAESDLPLAGADVAVVHYGADTKRTALQTDAAGEVRAPVPTDFFGMGVLASAPGRVPLFARWSEHEVLSLPREYTIRLKEGARVIGRVIDQQGNGVGGAKIHINGPGVEWNRRESVTYNAPASTPVTDAQGYWEGNFLAPDTKWVAGRVSHAEFAETTFSTNLVPGEVKQLLFTLQHGGPVSGIVRSSGGTALENAEVELQDLSGWRRNRKVKSSPDGQFSFERVASGEFRLRVTATDFKAADVLLPLGSSGTNVSVTLQPTQRAGEAILRGRVLTDRGVPIGYAQVRLQPSGPDAPLQWDTYVDDEGRFEWRYAPDRPLTLWVNAGRSQAKVFQVVPDGTEHELRLESERKLRLSGTVNDASSGAPIRGAKLMLQPSEDGQPGMQSEWLGEAYDGHFAFMLAASKFQPGRSPYSPQLLAQMKIRTNATLLVEAEGYRKKSVDLPRQTNDIEISIALEAGGAVTGLVLLPNGQPAAGASVGFSTKTVRAFMETPGKFADPYDPEQQLTVTGLNGTFRLDENFNAERLLITHEHGWLVARLPSGRSEEFQLQPWGQVTGQVGLGGKPSPGATVRIQAGSKDPDHMGFAFDTKTDDQGNFTFPKVPGGKVEVSLLNSLGKVGVFSHAQVVEVRAGEISRATIGGNGVRVVGRLEPGVEKAAVDWTASGHHLQMDAFAGQFGRPAYGFFCQPDGTFEILDVIPGEYRLIFHLEGKTEEVDRIGNRHRARLGTLVKTVTVNGTETDLGVFNMPPKRASGPMQSVPLF